MQEKEEVLILNNKLIEIRTIVYSLEKTILDELKDFREEINTLLSNYYCSDRGTVSQHSVREESLEINTNGHGSFIVDYE